MRNAKSLFDVRKLTYLSMLTALVIILQLVIAPLIGSATGGVLSPALVLIPMVLGVASCGIGAGAWLGGVFSLIVMFDPTTVPFLEYRPFLTVLLVFAKGIGAGLLSGLIFKLFSNKNQYLGVTLAALAAPFANTGIFVLGCLAFFRKLTGVGVYTLFISANFGAELLINLILVPAIFHILKSTKILEKK